MFWHSDSAGHTDDILHSLTSGEITITSKLRVIVLESNGLSCIKMTVLGNSCGVGCSAGHTLVVCARNN